MFERLRGPVWRLAYFVYASVALSSFAEAQMTSGYGQASTAVTGTRYTLTGTVVNSVSGDPISRALVQLSADRQRSAMTDQQGRFQIEDLPSTRVMVQQVRKPGFFDEQQVSRRRTPIDVGSNAAPLVLKLVPEAIIIGRVTDENREPMEHVPVKVTSVQIQNGRKQWMNGNLVRTNAEGEFRLANMQPGTYYVSAGPARSGTMEIYNPFPTEPGYPVAFYPGVSDLSAAGPFQLSGGQIAQADITMSPATWFVVSGIVTGYAEGSLPDLQFVNRAGNSALMSMSFDPSSGKFEARVFAGQCFIKARASEPFGKVFYADVPVIVNSNLAGIRVSLLSGGIPVVVQKQRTKPASAYADDPRKGGQVAFFNDPTFEARMSVDANVQLISTDPAHHDTRATFYPGDNQWIVRDAENGRYITAITPMGAWYVQSATHAGVDLLSQELAVVPGESRPIEIVLRDDFATLTATVQGWGDEPDKFTQFVIVPERAPFSARLTSSSGRSGEAGLGMYAPGDYRVYAFDRVDGLEYMNPEVLRAYDGYAARVSLLPDQKSSVNVQLIRRND